MKDNLTSITLVIDRSGSMASVKDEAENGLNHFVEEQKKCDGECVLTLIDFDTEYEVIHSAVPIKDVPKYQLEPRGWTALLDAVGRAINETGEKLSAMPEADRPSKVVFVIVTDGHENSSHEFTKSRIQQMVEHQREQYQWQFVYLGADAAAFADAGDIGITRGMTAQYDKKNIARGFSTVCSNVASYRSTGDSNSLSWSDEDRKALVED